MSTSDRTMQQVTLPHVRRLGFAEFGDLSGVPVLSFSGAMNARFIRHPDDSIIMSLGTRLITTDRPGTGLSDGQPARTLLDWPDDIM